MTFPAANDEVAAQWVSAELHRDRLEQQRPEDDQ